MSAPDLRHARWCSEPPLRPSVVRLSRHQVRWRCPECGAECYVIGTVPEAAWTEPTR